MATPITVPRLGWNMEEGVFGGWLKANGEAIRPGDLLFRLESDKATEDIECLDQGFLHIPTTTPRQGDTIPVNAIIGYVLQPGEPPPTTHPLATLPVASQSILSPDRPTSSPKLPTRTALTSSPRARRIAASLGVDWRKATATGRTGRIREQDIRALAEHSRSSVSPTRRVIAQRMLESHLSTAPVTLITTLNATNLVHFRNRLKSSFADPLPGYTDILILLSALALTQHPILNGHWAESHIVFPDSIDIGMAIDTEVGLFVPIVRNVPALNLKQLSMTTRDLINRARQRKLTRTELQDGTFTITSLGSLGIDAFTPILNPPQCAALGVGRIRRSPVVENDKIVIRDQMTLSLTFDHRITDGAPAARFLQTLSSLIENLSEQTRGMS